MNIGRGWLPILILNLMPGLCFASTASDIDSLISSGIKMYQSRKFADCVTSLSEVSLNPGLSPEQKGVSELYVAACQVALGDYVNSPTHIQYVESYRLSENDLKVYKSVSRTLAARANKVARKKAEPQPITTSDDSLEAQTVEKHEPYQEITLNIAVGMYQREEYAACATNLTELSTHQLSSVLKSEVQLYLAACKVALGDYANAGQHIKATNPANLPAADRALYKETRERVVRAQNLPAANLRFYPYAGASRFVPNERKRSAAYVGLASELNFKGLTLNLSGERFGVKYSDSSLNYEQTQVTVGAAYAFEFGLSLRARFATIILSQDQDPIRTGGIGASYWLFTKTRLNTDVYVSTYPVSVLGPFTALQLSGSIDQWFFSSKNAGLWLRLGYQQIDISGLKQVEPITGLDTTAPFGRVFGSLNLDLKDFKIAAGLWAGHEAYGVRNDATLIYNLPETHTFGWDARLMGGPLEKFGIQYAVSQEYYQSYGTTYHADTASVLLMIPL